MTIGTLTLYRGIAQGILPTDTIGGFPTDLTNIGVVPIPHTHIPYSIAFFAVLRSSSRVVLHATPLGRAIFAIGAGQEAAFFAGHPRQAHQVLAVRALGDAERRSPACSGRSASRRRATTPASGWSSSSSRSCCSAAISIFGGRGTIARRRARRLPCSAALQTALTADLVPAQDQNIVVGALLVASVIVPNGGDLYRPRARRVCAAPGRAARAAAAPGGERSERASAIFGIGLAAYWPQFDGLRERLEGYQRGHRGRASRALGAEVVSAGLVDTPQGAREAGELLAARARRPRAALHRDLRDLVAGAAGRAGGQGAGRDPQPAADAHARLRGDDDRASGSRTARRAACPELAGAFTRARIPYRTVTGTLLDGDPAWDVLREWVDAAAAVRSLRRARLGFLGHTYPGMLDMYSDFTQVHAQTGAHVEVLEIDDLVERVESATRRRDRAQGRRDPRDVRSRRRRASIRSPTRSRPSIFEWSARVAVGLDRLVDDFALDGLTYYYRGLGGNIAERVGGRTDRRQLAAHRARRPGRPARAT